MIKVSGQDNQYNKKTNTEAFNGSKGHKVKEIL